MNKKLITVISSLVVVGMGLGTWYFDRTPDDPSTLQLTGNVDIRQVSLSFNDMDRIAALSVREGDRVKAGQALGMLETKTLTLRIAQAQAQVAAAEQALHRLESGNRPEEIAQAKGNVRSAKAEAELADRQVARLRTLWQSTSERAVSQDDLDNALARQKVALAKMENAKEAQQVMVAGARKEDIGQAQAQLEVARAGVALLTHQLEQAELKAPIDAVVRARLLEPGDMASPQRPVYTLAITDPKWVRAYVSEVDLGRIRSGMKARVTIDSDPDRAIPGQIGYISSVAEFTPKTVQTEELRTSLVYEVRVLVDDAEDRLRLGMPATVRISVQSPAPYSSAVRK